MTDGETVFALGRNGVVVAVDPLGKRRWIRAFPPHESPKNGYDGGHAASPGLAGGLLVVAYEDLVGLDPASGAERWRLPAYRDFGTPARVVVDVVDYLALRDGRVVEASTGTLALTLPASTWYVGPVAVGPRVVYAGGRAPTGLKVEQAPEAVSFQLSRADGRLSYVERWRVRLGLERYFSGASTRAR